MSYANGGDQEGGVFKTIRSLGKALGVGVSILATPAVFEATRWKLLAYLTRSWGDDIGELLTWTMAIVEAYVIYISITLAFVGVVIWIMTSIAANRFRDGG